MCKNCYNIFLFITKMPYNTYNYVEKYVEYVKMQYGVHKKT